jgi:hypothetical protein
MKIEEQTKIELTVRELGDLIKDAARYQHKEAMKTFIEVRIEKIIKKQKP